MADLHIFRTHALGLREIRKIAFAWAETAEADFGMQCVYQEGYTEDELIFTGPGVQGLLWARHGQLEIKVELGIWLLAIKSKIENEIMKNIDLHLQGSAK